MTNVPVGESHKPVTVLFFGSQGSGKGTQVKLLMEYLSAQSNRKIIQIDMGQLLRDAAERKDHTGEIINYFLINGLRVPDFLPTYLQTKKLIDSFTGEEHIIADGLARGADQTRAFDDMMLFYNRHDLQIIDMQISEDTAVERLVKRGRNDDTPEAIRNRLGWYKTDVIPQLEMLRERGRTIHVIDGEPDVDTIHHSILKSLGLEK
ncbi:MAG TPA: nucleoside monophosphate kinase [Candidatus Paceibacterota bacterium]|nr:nucleoside monophosphate kinase [Candidatus Paceibacterota bacterium]